MQLCGSSELHLGAGRLLTITIRARGINHGRFGIVAWISDSKLSIFNTETRLQRAELGRVLLNSTILGSTIFAKISPAVRGGRLQIPIWGTCALNSISWAEKSSVDNKKHDMSCRGPPAPLQCRLRPMFLVGPNPNEFTVTAQAR